MHTINITLSFY